jgi:hypothetical protein
MATITESFNKANADTLGPDLSWTEDASDFDVVSNKAQDAGSAVTHAWARADSDLDSDDHYVEAVLNTSANDSFHGLMCRKDSTTANTYYLFQLDAGSNLIRVFKRVSGSFTSLANLAATINTSTNYTVRMEVSGSDIECFVDGGSIGTTSDATITGNTRCGLVGFYVTGGTVCTWDDFEAADLGGAVSTDANLDLSEFDDELSASVEITEVTVQILSPIQDVTVGAWHPSSGSPAELWEMVDGDKSPDQDYAYTNTPSTMEVRFSPGNAPSVQTGHVVRYRLRGDGSTDAIVRLKQGVDVIASWTEANVPAVDTDYEHTLDASPSFTISDYSDLRLSVEAV